VRILQNGTVWAGLWLSVTMVSCSSTTATTGDSGGGQSSVGGSTNTGGGVASGGSSSGGTKGTTTAVATGGASVGGSTIAGGTSAAAGNSSLGGTSAAGGVTATGGVVTTAGTGTYATGGVSAAGGTVSKGGATTTAGATSAGGTKATGGTASTGRTTAALGTGGGQTTGGVGTGEVGTGGNSTAVTVKLDSTQQTMDGFGINDTWAPAMSDSEADALLDPTRGLGLSILRIGMGSDGNPMSDNIFSDVKKAKTRGVDKIIGTPWTATANCKDNHLESNGGHLLTNCYESWAETIAAFPAKVKSNASVDLYAMSVQNEPDYAGPCAHDQPCSGSYPSMLFTAEEMVAFIKVVGPKLHAASPSIKVIAPETSEWIHLWTNDSAPGSTDALNGKYDYGNVLAKDTDAWAQVDMVGTHQYDTQVAEPWPSGVPQTKPVWMTEMSGPKGWPEEGPSSDINNGVAVAVWIHDAIVRGQASAWLWLWYKAISTGDNEGLLLDSGTDTKRHYTLGNFSRFIRPGYTRVDITGSIPTDVLLSAYKGTDGTVVIVTINKGSASVTVRLTISGGTAPASLTPWVTSASDNLAAKTAVTASGGSFTATLDSKTVTTFVGK
jgi:glucuronoarabinoxylan endo-1,4-beta-xylanase